MNNNNLTINVYNDKDEVVKTATAELISIRFGTVRSIMALLKVDDIDNTSELLKVVYGAWNEVIVIMRKVFPELTEEDFDNIQINELIVVLVRVLRASFGAMLAIPSDSKNA